MQGFQLICFHSLSIRQLHRYRKALLRSILRQDAAWHERNSAGVLIQKFTA